MLDPKYLSNVSKGVSDLWGDFETQILSDIAERISILDLNATTMWKVKKAKEMGLQQDYLNKELSKMLKVSELEISNLMKSTINQSMDNDFVCFVNAYNNGILDTLEFDNERINDLLTTGIKATNGEIKNFSKSYYASVNQHFLNSLDLAYMNVQSGYLTQAQASEFAINNLATKGITEFKSASGRHEKVETIVSRAVRTGVNLTAGKITLELADELDSDLVEVSSHLGARENHAFWQGQIFSLSGEHKKYKDFKMSTNYGNGDGLCGWNCRHSFYPFFEFLDEPTDEKVDSVENSRIYKLEQEQRNNERMIREYKKRSSIKQSGDVNSLLEKRKLREWTTKNNKLISENPKHLKRDYAKEKIPELDKETLKSMYDKKRKSKLSKGYNNAIDKGEILALVQFEAYEKIAKEVEDKILGITVNGGIIITGYKTHFIDRIIGQYQSSNHVMKGWRKGVSSVDDLVDCLINPKDIKNKHKDSITFISENFEVTINNKNHELLQTNRVKKKGVKK